MLASSFQILKISREENRALSDGRKTNPIRFFIEISWYHQSLASLNHVTSKIPTGMTRLTIITIL